MVTEWKDNRLIILYKGEKVKASLPTEDLISLTLKAQKNAFENVVCWNRLLQIIA